MADDRVNGLTQQNFSQKQPLVSVIIPVYKVEAYLRECVDSVIAQTYRNIEIILVDDGSPDNCPVICDEYAVKDERVRVIHQENKGVSVARNIGLKVASGKWITFVDSDDWIDKNYLKAMLSKSENVQIVATKVFSNLPVFSYRTTYSTQENAYGFIFCSCWGKLFLSSIIKDENIQFPQDVKLGEDTFFTYSYLIFINKAVCTDNAYYHYNSSNVNSLTSNACDSVIFSCKKCFTELEKYVISKKAIHKLEKNLYERKMYAKNLYIYSKKRPDFKEWRNTFPELNKCCQKDKNYSLFRRFFYFVVVSKNDCLAYLLFIFYKSAKAIFSREKGFHNV